MYSGHLFHDISMILNLVKSKLETVDAEEVILGTKDTSITTLKFKNKVKAHIFILASPYKDQRLVVIGEKYVGFR